MTSTSPLVAPAPRSADEGHKPLPALLVVGPVVMAAAFGLDVAAHSTGLTSLEPMAHEAGVLGMLLTWGAVMFDGLRNNARSA